MRGILAKDGNLVVVDFGRTDEPELTKKQLERVLQKSGRYIEKRMAEGMPSTMKRGKRMFLASECREWLERHGRRAANG